MEEDANTLKDHNSEEWIHLPQECTDVDQEIHTDDVERASDLFSTEGTFHSNMRDDEDKAAPAEPASPSSSGHQCEELVEELDDEAEEVKQSVESCCSDEDKDTHSQHVTTSVNAAENESSTSSNIDIKLLPDCAWSRTERHMDDIRYAQKSTVDVPRRILRQKMKILVTGQPETGRTTAMKNLFASIVQDPAWAPTDVSGLTLEDFQTDPDAFTTVIEDRKDTAGNLSIKYVIQETPGLRGCPIQVAEVLRQYMNAQHLSYAAQEGQLGVKREDLEDDRVDVVLYFLPTNARIGESNLDFTVINCLAAFAPVIPLMCKADCLEDDEILQRKTELERLREAGLQIFSFPENIVTEVTNNMQGLSQDESRADEVKPPEGQSAFRPPFNIVAGANVDPTVHQFWFVRKYRWAECEAYRTSNSDLRLLRQLLLEEGFWYVKDEAEALYRKLRAATESAVDSPKKQKSSSNCQSIGALESVPEKPSSELRPSGRGSCLFTPWSSSEESKTSNSLPIPSNNLRNVVSTRGLGAPLRPNFRAQPSPKAVFGSMSPPTENPFQYLSVHSDDSHPLSSSDPPTALLNNEPVLPWASKVAAANWGNASQACNTNSVATAAAPAAMPADTFNTTKYVRAKVRDALRSVSKNYRLTLTLENDERLMCLRIGENEGLAINCAVNQSVCSRPTMYDSAADMHRQLGCEIERVVITECKNTVFHANVVSVNRAACVRACVDARPSDAINLALRHGSPIYISKAVVQAYAK